MSQDRIEKGDLIDVFFEQAPGIANALVLALPEAEDQSWILRSEDGPVVYVLRYRMIVLRRKAIGLKCPANPCPPQ